MLIKWNLLNLGNILGCTLSIYSNCCRRHTPTDSLSMNCCRYFTSSTDTPLSRNHFTGWSLKDSSCMTDWIPPSSWSSFHRILSMCCLRFMLISWLRTLFGRYSPSISGLTCTPSMRSRTSWCSSGSWGRNSEHIAWISFIIGCCLLG